MHQFLRIILFLGNKICSLPLLPHFSGNEKMARKILYGPFFGKKSLRYLVTWFFKVPYKILCALVIILLFAIISFFYGNKVTNNKKSKKSMCMISFNPFFSLPEKGNKR